MRKQAQRAFTLIEILIVVVILGILAAIVIPQFTDASDQAMASSVRSQLQTLRGQIELFKVQRPDLTDYDDTVVAPGDATFWDQLIALDFIQQAPKNPMQNNSVTVAAAPAAGVGWVWVAGELSAVGTDDALYAD